MKVEKIETYSLFEFCQKTQQAILAGWRFDFEDNENAPISYGSMLVAGMVKDDSSISESFQAQVTEGINETGTQTIQTEEVVQDTEQTTEIKEVAKRGPKPKAK